MIIERLSREHRNIEKLLAILERELEISTAGIALTSRLFTRLSVISRFTRGSTTIPRKIWFSPS